MDEVLGQEGPPVCGRELHFLLLAKIQIPGGWLLHCNLHSCLLRIHHACDICISIEELLTLNRDRLMSFLIAESTESISVVVVCC